MFTKAKGSTRAGVAMLFKLKAGEEVAVHAATPITTQIKASANISLRGFRREVFDVLLIALKWEVALVIHFHCL
jgi:hypothetical protein